MYSTWTSHRVTVVGYDDTFKEDVNGDGLYTNHIDVNGDGKINIRDWEIGALKFVNSYGENWPTFDIHTHGNGFFYIPYRKMPTSGFFVCKVKLNHPVELAVKFQIISKDRRVPKTFLNYGENADDDLDGNDLVGFQSSVGLLYNTMHTGLDSVPMQGSNRSDTVEVWRNFGYHFGDKGFGKIIMPVCKIPTSITESAKIGYFSLIDYRWGEEFEIYCDERDYEIPYTPGAFSTLFINYDLLPFEINEDLNLPADMVSRFSPTVGNGATLSVEKGTKIDMYNSELIIEPGAALHLSDNVIFTAKRGVSKIIVYGDLQLGNHVQFMADEGSQLIVEIRKEASLVSLEQAHFTRSSLAGFTDMEVKNCIFSESNITQNKGDVIVEDCIFNYSFIDANYPTSNPNFVYVANCDFMDDNTKDFAIRMKHARGYQINDCYISGYAGNGIVVNWSGDQFGAVNIRNCQITHCGDTDPWSAGIQVYNSPTKIFDGNMIAYNPYGIHCLNNSRVSIMGDKSATSVEETQNIINNSINQIYATSGSFPYECHWNHISCANNNTPLIYYSTDIIERKKSVRHNYWGLDFNPNEDLYPIDLYVWNPVWQLAPASNDATSAQALFNQAHEDVAAENYTQAQSGFKQIVSQYPDSKYAEAALKDLLALELKTEQNYESLKTYYANEEAINNNEELRKLASSLSNDCDIKLENYADAIAWYESIIENPATIEDSLFAIIDLGELYLMMEENDKSACIGKMLQYKPKDKQSYEKNRKYWISLLFGNKVNVSNTSEKEPAISSWDYKVTHTPNPVADKVNIHFNLEKKSTVKLMVFNQLGNVVLLKRESFNSGNQKIKLNTSKWSSGIYFYKLQINSKVIGTSKIVIL